MKLLIIGGTGKTGKHLIAQALEQGHKITALVRKPTKIKIQHSELTVIAGNVLNYNDVLRAVSGQDAVLSALGHKRFIIKTDILSRGTANILKAMEREGVTRFVCITSLGIGDSRFKLGLYYNLFVIPFILFFYFLDKEKQERLIKASALNWTIVRPGQLTNGKLRGKYRHGLNLGSYILTKMVSRRDVAHFMLGQLNDTSYIHKTPAIIY